MSTIDSKAVIDKLIANNGAYEDDPPAYMIVEYTNAWGNTTWGVTWTNEPFGMKNRYLEETDFVQNPKIIWKRIPDVK